MLKPTDSTRARARRERRRPTSTEAAVWKLLRARRFDGLKFRRQVPIGPYVADIFCPALKLVIELDGGVHRLRAEADADRDRWLTAQGLCVVRLSNDEARGDAPRLVQAIEARRRELARTVGLTRGIDGVGDGGQFGG